MAKSKHSRFDRSFEDGFRSNTQNKAKTKNRSLRNINPEDALYVAENDEDFQPYFEKFRRN